MLFAARGWLIAGLLAAGPAAATEIVIGTASEAGVYFQLGRAICHYVNLGTAEHGITCRAEPTEGSIFNLENLRAGRLQLGVVQSDWQHHAFQGTSHFSGAGPFEELRALFSAHGEPFTVVARRDAGFTKLDDLKGGRVNLGNPGSGQRATMEVVLQAKGWTEAEFMLAEALPASQQSLALCHARIQAMVYTVGHPNPSVDKAVGLCDAVIVEVKDEAIDKLVAANPFYAYTQVPGGLYAGNPEPVTTFGVKATLVSSAAVDADVIHAVVAAVFDNLDQFKLAHPAFASLEQATMAADALSAPLHEGAARYFATVGLR